MMLYNPSLYHIDHGFADIGGKIRRPFQVVGDTADQLRAPDAGAGFRIHEDDPFPHDLVPQSVYLFVFNQGHIGQLDIFFDIGINELLIFD
jgi:hypothetical protein